MRLDLLARGRWPTFPENGIVSHQSITWSQKMKPQISTEEHSMRKVTSRQEQIAQGSCGVNIRVIQLGLVNVMVGNNLAYRIPQKATERP